MQRFIVLTFLSLFIFCGQVFAVELDVYKDDLKTSKNDLYNLIADEDGNFSQKEIFAKVRKKLPPNEKVEWKGLSVETENSWINEKLSEVENNPEKQYETLTEITQRISAIETRIEILQLETEGKFSKQDYKQKLDEILNRTELKQPVKEEKKKEEKSWLQKQIDALFEWLESLFPKGQPTEGDGTALQGVSLIIQIVVIRVAIALIAFIIYRFAPFLMARFGNRYKKDKGTRVILGEKILANQSSADLLDEAEKLAHSGDLRLAIRKGYIALLCELSDRKLIGLAQHKTNRDYLRDVRKHQNIFQKMRFLTNSFETHWYGFATADEKDWEEFRQYYKETLSK
jgi:hypothetical protein